MGCHLLWDPMGCQCPWGAVRGGWRAAGRDTGTAQCFATIAKGCWVRRVVGALRDAVEWGFDTTFMTHPEHLRPSGSLHHPEHPSAPDTLQVPELLVSEVALGHLVACHVLQNLSSSCIPRVRPTSSLSSGAPHRRRGTVGVVLSPGVAWGRATLFGVGISNLPATRGTPRLGTLSPPPRTMCPVWAEHLTFPGTRVCPQA